MKTQQERQECLSQEGKLFQQGATPSSLNSITQNCRNLEGSKQRENFTNVPHALLDSDLSPKEIMRRIRRLRNRGAK